MELLIGNRIKQLRKEQGMTQEHLAERMGLSFQAISKWENNISLPDITLVPKLADVFGVTTDDLFAYHADQRQKDIKDYVDRASRLRETDAAEGRKILEEGLAKYPDDDILLNNLLYVMDYKKEPDETIRIAGKLMDKTTMSDVRYDALRFLAYAYNAKGDTESAVAALEQIPEIYFTKLSEMAFILEGRPKLEAAAKQKWISFEILLQMMWKIAEVYEAQGNTEKAITETEKALSLIAALDGDDKIENFAGYRSYFNKQLERMRHA